MRCINPLAAEGAAGCACLDEVMGDSDAGSGEFFSREFSFAPPPRLFRRDASIPPPLVRNDAHGTVFPDDELQRFSWGIRNPATLLPVLYEWWRLTNLSDTVWGRHRIRWMCAGPDTLGLLRDSAPRSISRSGARKDAPLIWGTYLRDNGRPCLRRPRSRGSFLTCLRNDYAPRGNETLLRLSGRPPRKFTARPNTQRVIGRRSG